MKWLLLGVMVFGLFVTTASAAPVFFLDFDTLPLNNQLHVPDPPWVTDGVTIDGREFFWLPSGSTVNGDATVQNLGQAGGSGRELWINHINLDFGFPVPLTYMDFLFGEYGGNLNIEINGDFRNFEDMQNIHGLTIGGATVRVTDFTGGAGGQGTGQVEVTGPINTFYVGGQEFVIDSMYAVPEPATAVLLGLSALLGFRTSRRRKPNR